MRCQLEALVLEELALSRRPRGCALLFQFNSQKGLGFALQVRSQLEALVAEKSTLAQENARLQRENCGLQELLSYTMQHAGGGPGDVLSAILPTGRV